MLISGDIKGKTAIITGSTSGIGLGIAKELAKAGANIIMNGLGPIKDIENSRKAIEKAAKDNGHDDVQVIYDAADMTKPQEIAKMIENAYQELGSVDILINNAGIQFVSPVEDFPLEKWNAIIDINMNASFHTSHHAIPLMKKNKWGRIINIVSAHGLVASPFKSAYVTAKHGVMGMTKTIALETAQDGITCNAICPGYVRTPLVDGQIADTAKARGITEDEVINDVLLKAQHTKKFTTIEQIAQSVLFICSDAADNMTGSHITLDGGWTAA